MSQQKKRFRKIILIGLAVAALYIGSLPTEVSLYGETMGTTYTIKAFIPRWMPLFYIKKQIHATLKRLDDHLSTYNPTSELSEFNKAPIGYSFEVSVDFHKMMDLSTVLYEKTSGKWDPTVKPLVALWGFYTHQPLKQIPTPEDIQIEKSKLGFKTLFYEEKTIEKTNEGVTLDFSSIAKGYGSDEVGRVLEGLGAVSYMVEIGGEIKVKGQKKDGTPWSIGIKNPDRQKEHILLGYLYLKDMGLATSGNYENFFEIKGQKYSHIINPITGYPTLSPIVSVTVIAPSTALADGWATALMVMTVDEAIECIENEEEVEAYIGFSENGEYRFQKTSGFPELIPL